MTPRRVNPTKHLYQGHEYIAANKTDVRLTWLRFAPKTPIKPKESK